MEQEGWRAAYSREKDRIVLISQKPRNTKEEIASIVGHEKVCACDFYIEGSEDWLMEDLALRDGSFFNIDHHSPRPELMHRVSSGNIAASYVKRNGILPSDYKVVLNHTDCDSIITAFIMLGIIEPEERFLRSVIAADHTGEEDSIADLLQSIEYSRNLDSISNSLFLMLEGKELPQDAKDMLGLREKNRERVRSMIEHNRFHKIGSIAVFITESNLDPAILVSLLPDSSAIMVSSQSKKDESRWIHRIRLGKDIDGVSLKNCNLPDFGGRWNAGSTRRHGGSTLGPLEYGKVLDQELDKLMLRPFSIKKDNPNQKR